MCNLYSLTKGQAAIRDWFRAQHDRTGNLPLFPSIFPDQFAPIVRRERIANANSSSRAGACRDRLNMAASPVTNIRNVSSRTGEDGWRTAAWSWRRASANTRNARPRKIPTWFALSEDRPLFAFAGLWTRWRGVRGPKSGPVEAEHELFCFLQTPSSRSFIQRRCR
jgi:putative SOS response-associated peptidase YedK